MERNIFITDLHSWIIKSSCSSKKVLSPISYSFTRFEFELNHQILELSISKF